MSSATVIWDQHRVPVMTSEEIRKEVLKWIGVVVAAIVPLGAIYGIASYIVRSEVADMRSDLTSIKSDIGELKTDSQKTNSRIDSLLAQALQRAFPSPTASQKTIGETLPQVRDLLRLAQSQSIKLDPQLLMRYGNQVAQVSQEPNLAKSALNVLGDVMACRSLLNAQSIPVSQKDFSPFSRATIPEADIDATVRSYLPNGEKSSTTFTVTRDKVVPLEESFVYMKLGATSPSPLGYAFLMIDGKNQTEFLLDGHQIRHVVFKNARIEYDGGPTSIQDVYFVNCTFDIKPIAASNGTKLEAFTNAVLGLYPVSFSAS